MPFDRLKLHKRKWTSCDGRCSSEELEPQEVTHPSQFIPFTSPLISCIFNKQNLESVAESYHTLKHDFLNCKYMYEWKELDTILTLNRMGREKARRQKLALHLKENPALLLQLELEQKL